VTAETAVVLPVLLAMVLGLVWLVALAATQVRVVDAARETARAAARDETTAQAVEAGQRVAPDASRITVADEGSSVVVNVVAQVRGPGGLFRFLPAVEVESRAVAAKEAP
jgi:Flp pilus assembly protein TadG